MINYKLGEVIFLLSWPKTFNNIHLFHEHLLSTCEPGRKYRNGQQSLNFGEGYLKVSSVQPITDT